MGYLAKAAQAAEGKGGKLTVKDATTGRVYTRLVNASQAVKAMTAEDADKGLAVLAGETVKVSSKVVTLDGIRTLSQEVTLPTA